MKIFYWHNIYDYYWITIDGIVVAENLETAVNLLIDKRKKDPYWNKTHYDIDFSRDKLIKTVQIIDMDKESVTFYETSR